MNSIITAVAKDDHFMVPTRPSRSSEHNHIANTEPGGKAKAVTGRKHPFHSEFLVYVMMDRTLVFPRRTPVVSMHICLCSRFGWGPSSSFRRTCTGYVTTMTCTVPTALLPKISPGYRALTPSVITHPGSPPLQAWH